jgi:hypothetical protein
VITRLFPTSTDVSGSGWNTFGASPAHIGLSDASDATGVGQQISSFEPTRWALGTAWTQLPATSGVIKALTLGFRVGVDIDHSASSFAQAKYAGTTLIQVSVADVPGTIATFTIVGGPQPFSKVNALTWYIQSDFLAHDGVTTSAYELWLDVEWYPIQAASFALMD